MSLYQNVIFHENADIFNEIFKHLLHTLSFEHYDTMSIYAEILLGIFNDINLKSDIIDSVQSNQSKELSKTINKFKKLYKQYIEHDIYVLKQNNSIDSLAYHNLPLDIKMVNNGFYLACDTFFILYIVPYENQLKFILGTTQYKKLMPLIIECLRTYNIEHELSKPSSKSYIDNINSF
jgi:hypothetical protein